MSCFSCRKLVTDCPLKQLTREKGVVFLRSGLLAGAERRHLCAREPAVGCNCENYRKGSRGSDCHRRSMWISRDRRWIWEWVAQAQPLLVHKVRSASVKQSTGFESSPRVVFPDNNQEEWSITHIRCVTCMMCMRSGCTQHTRHVVMSFRSVLGLIALEISKFLIVHRHFQICMWGVYKPFLR